MKTIYTSIDIGSDTVKFIVSELYKDKFNILASHTIKTKGIRKGLIVDANLVINTLKDGVKEINNNLGIEIKKAIVNVPSYNSKFIYTETSKEITSEDSKITKEDINELIKKSVYSKIPNDYELLTVQPLDFIIDSENKNPYPVGKTGKNITLKAIIIATPKKNIYSVVSVMEASSIELTDITISGLADYYEVRNDSTDKKVGAIINLGHETTTVSIFNRGKIMNTETIQIGGRNIERDLARVFNMDIFETRVLKEKFASAHKRFLSLTEVFEIKNTVGEVMKLSQLEVSEVVMARLSEILELAKKQILLLTKQKINYVILTGGLTEIKHFKNLCFEIFGKDVIIYSVDTLGVRDNKYTTALGMVKYFNDKMLVRGKNYTMIDSVDESLLITPKNNNKKNDKIITKIFGSFLSNSKED